MSPVHLRKSRSSYPAPQFSLRWLLGFVAGVAVLCGAGRQWGWHVAFGVAFLVLGLILVGSLMILLPRRIVLAGIFGAIGAWIVDSLWWGWTAPLAIELAGGAALGMWIRWDSRVAIRLSGLLSSHSSGQTGRPAAPRWLRTAIVFAAIAASVTTALLAWTMPPLLSGKAKFSWSELLEAMASQFVENLSEETVGRIADSLVLMWPAHAFACLAVASAIRQWSHRITGLERNIRLFNLALAQSLACVFLAALSAEVCYRSFTLMSLNSPGNDQLWMVDVVSMNATCTLLLLITSCAITGRRFPGYLRNYGWLVAIGLIAVAGCLASFIVFVIIYSAHT